MLKASCKFGESKWNPYLLIALTSSTSTNHGLNKHEDVDPRGGYSLYVGWYGCAAILTLFFDILRIELDLFGVFFLIHQHQNDLLGY